eukprot:9139186-Pyramimonas_sp.AAC.1
MFGSARPEIERQHHSEFHFWTKSSQNTIVRLMFRSARVNIKPQHSASHVGLLVKGIFQLKSSLLKP